jgi:hypothetical protein
MPLTHSFTQTNQHILKIILDLALTANYRYLQDDAVIWFGSRLGFCVHSRTFLTIYVLDFYVRGSG